MWHFLRGYVILQIEGLSAARLLRRMTEHGIRVRRAVRTSPGCMQLTIDAKHFFALKRLKRGLPVRIHIVRRVGLPFLWMRIKKRPVLMIGTVLIGLLIFFASDRIWLFRVEGTERIDPNEVLERLAEKGLSVGARVEGPILITAANELSAEIPDAAWVGLDREGITLTAKVVESLPASPKKTQQPSDVIAEKDGVLIRLVVTHGQARAAVGDAVKAGDVLISGTVVRNDAAYTTWADGTALAAVTYSASCEVQDTVIEWIENGETQTVKSVYLGSLKLFGQRPKCERYRVLKTETTAVGDRLPITIETVTIGVLIERERALTEQEAEQLALQHARDAALQSVPKDAAILHQYGVIRRQNGTLAAEVTIMTEETIGRTEERPHGGTYGESGGTD